MTANKYFEYAAICYKACSYDYETVNLSDAELYKKYADHRDGGLRDIIPDSKKDFNEWYKSEKDFGSHLYEIMPGHSFSRLSLYIMSDDQGYYLALPGDRILRYLDIANIYLALKDKDVPIEIHSLEMCKEALQGQDYLGVIPDWITPIYCESLFKEYHPKTFIHIPDKKILKHIKWESIEKTYLKHK